MGDDIRIGMEPPPAPPPRSGKLLGLAAGLVLLVSAAAWLLGAFREASPPGAADAPTSTLPLPTTTTTFATTTTDPAFRLARTRAFWQAVGAGDAVAAAAAVAAPDPGAADLIAFVAAFSPGLEVGDCRPFAANAVQCEVRVTNPDLLAIGLGTAPQRLLLSDDGWFDVPSPVTSSAARLSLHALNLHTEEVQAACPLTGNPQVPGLAIVGSATASCGAYLAGLIPEYLGADDTTTLP